MGNSARTTYGLGRARPATIDYGGDPTGIVEKISWSTWGGKTATGRGIGFFVPADQAVAGGIRTPAAIRAYGLTTCDGHPAYRTVIWWFPSKGETFSSAIAQGGGNYNLCTDQ